LVSLVEDVSEGWYCVVAPGFKIIPCFNEAGLQIYLQAFVPPAAVEVLDETVFRWSALA
jgi:hypothetical protein